MANKSKSSSNTAMIRETGTQRYFLRPEKGWVLMVEIFKAEKTLTSNSVKDQRS